MSTRDDFEAEVRRLLVALDELLDLLSEPSLSAFSRLRDELVTGRDDLVASLQVDDPNERRVELAGGIKSALHRLCRHDDYVEASQAEVFREVARLVYVFQDARFTGLKGGKVSLEWHA